jgi:DNA-binding MarR family transcriptional regulator
MRFLRSVASLEPIQLKQKDLSTIAILLLNEIAVKDFDEQPLTVSQAIDFKSIGSPATLHRKIDELRNADMVLVTNVGTDRRTKYLFLTQAAKDLFQIKYDAMLKAVQSR